MHTFIHKIMNYIENNRMLSAGDTVVMGVSGGADSTALFLTFLELRKKYDLSLKVVHINHGLRAEAKDEAKIVEKLCKDNDVDFFLYEYDVNKISKEQKKGTEEVGRNLRYEAFSKVLAESGCKDNSGKIAVAHNQNDQSETMLFHLFRGTGIKGLCSIPPVRGDIIRPLLCVTRDEIEHFLEDMDMPYCTDASNFTDDYTRNRIRNNLIPLIKDTIADRPVENMASAIEQLREIDDCLNRIAKKTYDLLVLSEHETVSFDRALFEKEDIYIQKMLIKKAIDELAPGNRDITHKHIESVIALLETNGYHEVNLPYELSGFVSYNDIGIKRAGVKNDTTKDNSEECGLNVVNLFEDSRFLCEIIDNYSDFEPSQKKYTKCFDYDRMKQSFEVRKRHDGDFIVVNGSGGTKKLKDYFIDIKIPKPERDDILLLADGNEIIWVVGYRISEAYKVTESTKKILKVTYLLEEE